MKPQRAQPPGEAGGDRAGGGAGEPGTAEILRAVRRVQLRTRRTVTDMVAGGFRSVFRGSGMEFEEVREYVPGDEVRAIDWNVTARMGHPYIKKFVEEREQTVMLAVDASASARLGSGARSVRQAAAELAAILAFSAAGSGDRAGLLLFSDRVELELPPRGGNRQAFRITREALYRESVSPHTSVALACDHLARVLKRRSYVFLLSDFLAPDFERPLGILARRHDVVGLRLVDALHHALPAAGLLRWRDPESGADLLVDSGSAAVRAALAERAAARQAALRSSFGRHGVDLVDIPVGGGVVEPLVAYLHQRERRLR
ncbi:MAG TPA: DUF58 domain-containing protein [Planctomycetota bacterium]|nr:DUF58 domain-containing protein [Planctomycetota bacterium]